MSQFLVVLKKKVIDVYYQPAVPEVVEDLTADPPIVGVPAVPEVLEESHMEVDRSYIEDSAEQIALNLERQANGELPNMEMYHITYNGVQLQAALQPVNLKAGPRTQAPAREIVEVEAGGQVVGSVTVEV